MVGSHWEEALLNWHRLFGIALIELFTDSGYEVELEKDLSTKQQYLDVVVVRRGAQPRDLELPDGLDHLAAHNLITYKSLHEPLDRWALDELISHFVNYRKLVSGEQLLPYEEFALFAVTTRFPRDLASQIDLEEILPGVLEVQWGLGKVWIMVLKRIREIPRNAHWLLFSGQVEKFLYAADHIHMHDDGKIDLIVSLNDYYREEGIDMPYTVEDYNRDVLKRKIHLLDPKDRLEGLDPQQRLEGLDPEQILRGLSPEQLKRLRQKLLEKPDRSED